MTKPRNSYHHGDLPRALRKAGVALIGEKGVAAVTLRDVARRVGVTHGAPYRHYADKTALVAAIAADGFARLERMMHTAAAEAGDDPLARLLAIGRSYVVFAAMNPAYFVVMYGSESPDRDEHTELAAADDRAFAVLVDSVRDAQAGGRLIDSDPTRLALLLWSMVHGATHILVSGDAARRGLPLEEFEAFMMDNTQLLLGGLLKR